MALISPPTRRDGIVFVLPSLRMGGAEGVAARLANGFAAEGERVTVIRLESGDRPSFQVLDPRVRLVSLGLTKDAGNLWEGALRNLHRLFVLRKTVLAINPATVISFGDRTNVRVLLALPWRRIPLIVSERSNPFRAPLAFRWKLLRRLVYSRARAVVTLNERCAAYFRPWLRGKVAVIPNPVAEPASKDAPLRENVILGLGRLVPVKGFDVLARAFHKIAAEIPAWRVVVQGEGPSRGELQRLVDELGLSERFTFPGPTQAPSETLSRASIFVLPSRYEGFPNALCEAMAGGVAVIAADCETGPRELISDGVDGVLVPPEDVDALAEALLRLARDPGARAALGNNARKVARKYRLEDLLLRWRALWSAERVEKRGAL